MRRMSRHRPGYAGVALAMVAAATSSSHATPVGTWAPLAGADLWHGGTTLHGGVLWHQKPATEDGWTFKALIAGGTYRYNAGGRAMRGQQFTTSLLPGHRWIKPGLYVTAFAGPELQSHRLTPDDFGNRLRGKSAGMRGGIEIWWQPATDFAVDLAANVTTIGGGYWMRAALGAKFASIAYVGPEMLAMGDARYRQWRVGAHVTAWRTGLAEWSGGAGFAWDGERRQGPYIRFGVALGR